MACADGGLEDKCGGQLVLRGCTEGRAPLISLMQGAVSVFWTQRNNACMLAAANEQEEKLRDLIWAWQRRLALDRLLTWTWVFWGDCMQLHAELLTTLQRDGAASVGGER